VWFAVIAGLALILVLASVPLYCGYQLYDELKSSFPYQEGLARARANSEVDSLPGVPIQDSFLFIGSLHTHGREAEASFSTPISGPSGKGTLFMEASTCRRNREKMEEMVENTGEN
jgi:hypothetical protein